MNYSTKAEMFDDAINYLFPDLEKDSTEYKLLTAYIRKKYKTTRCVVLYDISIADTSDGFFPLFLRKHNLSCGKKEVIITEDSLYCIPDYHKGRGGHQCSSISNININHTVMR